MGAWTLSVPPILGWAPWIPMPIQPDPMRIQPDVDIRRGSSWAVVRRLAA